MSVQTLLDIACGANVALLIRFVSYPVLMRHVEHMSVHELQPETIYETLDRKDLERSEIEISDDFSASSLAYSVRPQISERDELARRAVLFREGRIESHLGSREYVQ